MIRLKQLVSVKAAIEHLNFGKAARSINLTQPALSRSIASLEETLGVKLFNRSKTGVSATVYGQSLKKYAEQILISVSELEREITLIKEGDLGELVVAIGPYVAEISGYTAVGQLISSSPDIKSKVIVSGWEIIEKLVLNRKVDLGIAELIQAKKNTYIETEPLEKKQGIVFCRSGHPLLEKKNVSKTDLEQWPLVFTKIPSRFASHIPGKTFQEEGGDHMLPSIQVDDLSLSRKIIRESDAIGIATPVQIESELENKTFSIVPYNSSSLVTNYGFMYLKDRALSPAAIAYMNIVRELEKDISTRNRELLEKYLP